MFRFVDDALSRGESVLISCATGTHRAGGAAVAYLMHRHRINYETALKVAQSKRSAIDPRRYHSTGYWASCRSYSYALDQPTL